MSDVIRLLPDSVANQIAAGEVIQRPASVLKELVENAVDAGATEIQIVIKDAGRTLIQVIDNGKGMSETDARLAFERHATSKINNASDLFSLQTMGFRGEALPSICAISQVELKTMPEGETKGTRLVISGSKVELQEPCICAKGSNFMVKNIFFNVPARRKFLKSDSVELSNIMREFERLALVNNNIKMSIDTGLKVHNFPIGSFKQRIGDIWKNNLNMQLVPIEVDTSLVKITGFVSRPEFARRRNPLQFLIVNGRNMRHPYFHKAIVACYDNLIASDTQPCYFIKFEVNPSTIDVNIHPTKNEIKFENEQQIWPILQASVKAALGKFAAVPSIDFDEDAMAVAPPRAGDFVEAPKIKIDTSYNPFNNPYDKRRATYSDGGNRNIGQEYRPTKVSNDWQKLYTKFVGEKKASTEEKSNVIDFQQKVSSAQENIFSTDVAPLCIQYSDKYIISPSRDGIMIIDQHRAHVRVLFERYLAMARKSQPSVQHVMFAELLELDEAQQLVFEGIEDDIRRLGFMIEYQEDNKWMITGVPTSIINKNPKDVILHIIDTVNENSPDYGTDDVLTSDRLLGKIALVMARSAAIQRGQKLSPTEMEHLMGELFRLENHLFTPTGNPIVKVISEQNIVSMFM